MQFMITKDIFWPMLTGLLVLSAGAGLVWRSLSSAAEESPPTLSQLRPAADIAIEPAMRWNHAAAAVAAADAIGVVRVTKVTLVLDARLPGIDEALPVFTGHGEVEARVLRVAKGERGALDRFSFDAFLRGGEILVPDLMPPLVDGSEYLVFVRGGRVVYPGGLYAIRDDRAWYIGAWSTRAASEPPRGAWSGREIDDIVNEIDAGGPGGLGQ